MQGRNSNITEGIRAFNRFYTNKIGLLNNRLYGSQFSLTEARIIFHVGENEKVTAKQMCTLFNLDPGYTSRTIKKLGQADILIKDKSKEDTRSFYLSLSPNGRHVLEGLVKISNGFIGQLLESLSVSERFEVLSSMEMVQSLLEKKSEITDLYTIRTWKPGDLSYVVSSHMNLYGTEYGFDGSFEYYVGKDVMAFGKRFDADKENLWIAENRNERVGSIAMVNNGNGVAQLRWLLVEASTRGHGIGEKLVDIAVGFAREKKYKKIILMTTDFLPAARRIYEKFGFKQISSDSEVQWGLQVNIEYLALQL
jgi:DNA-binding MarR family transcriptional regulator/N-acetylglutamate synthase-like GNAT family acetyltransferase